MESPECRASKKVAIIQAPSALGLEKTGVEGLADTLLSAGLANQLSARKAGQVTPLPHSAQRDPKTGLLNAQAIAQYSKKLADMVSNVLDDYELPLVLGGDCSILLGSLLALRRRGRFGLFFADGHADFYQPEANINGEVASSDLAFATGRGPSILTKLDGFDRLVRDEDVVLFGFRDEEEQRKYGSQPLPPSIFAMNLANVRRLGAKEAAQRTTEHLSRHELEGFWLHLDADVLSDSIMPAVDYRQPDGLSWEELVTLLQVVLSSRRAVGLEITIYNPLLDPGHRIAFEFVAAIALGFKTGDH